MKSVIIATLLVPALALADGSIDGTVDAKPSKFLPDTIVYLKKVDATKLTAKTAMIDQKGMTFSPHITLLAVGDSVQFDNHDNVDHNVMSPEGNYDLGTYGQGKSKTQTYSKEGVFSQVCKIHPEMLAYVFVGQNRFSAVVDSNGKFAIAGVPAGSYELDVWNPKLKAAAQKITVTDGKLTSTHFDLTR